MNYLGEYEMLWANKVVKSGYMEVSAITESGAMSKIIEEVKKSNKKASVNVLEIISVGEEAQ